MFAFITGKPNPKIFDQEEKKPEIPDKDKIIGAHFHCKGGLITFSFHVKATDQIKCYLFWYVIVLSDNMHPLVLLFINLGMAK